MPDFTVVTRGPWRIRTSISEDKAAISYLEDGRSEVVSVETLADLALLRDAINEYLDAQEPDR